MSSLVAFGLMSPLDRWELAEYFGEAVVIVGVLLEYLVEFHFLQKVGQRRRQRKVARLGSIVLLFGLAIELTGLVKTSQLTGGLISGLDIEAGDAKSKASAARTIAGEADTNAKGARTEAYAAEGSSRLALSSAGTAQNLANGASALARKAGQEAIQRPRNLARCGQTHRI